MSLLERIAEVLGPVAWALPDRDAGEPAIDIHVIAPTVARPYYTLFTTGMSTRPMTVPDSMLIARPLELSSAHAISPSFAASTGANSSASNGRGS